MALLIIGVIGVLFYYYGKFLGNMMVKREKKRIAEKNPSDKDILKYYKNYNPTNAFVFFFFGVVVYFPIKKAYEEIWAMYKAEAQRRSLELPN